jgi:hypothetical protein
MRKSDEVEIKKKKGNFFSMMLKGCKRNKVEINKYIHNFFMFATIVFSCALSLSLAFFK